MKITIVGTGYVGLVSGICFAEMGNEVICLDIDFNKINNLQKGIVPIYEPGLEEMIGRNFKEHRLFFSTDVRDGVEKSDIIFIAVGTPPKADGTVEMRYIYEVASNIGRYMDGYKIIVNKSTVPVGTGEKVGELIHQQLKTRNVDFAFDVASNPEFLKEGAAIEDFMKPDRIVIGTENPKVAETMQELYSYFVRNGHPILVMDVKSAEMTKYAANAMLATKISFINEMAAICESVGADIDLVRKGIGADSRIGYKFLYPGPGFGGSCFPKDVLALTRTAEECGCGADILKAVDNVNKRQKQKLLNKITKYYGDDLTGKTFAIWGLSFKPKTNDMREAPSVTVINGLLERGAKIRAYDPQAMDEARKIFKSDSVSYHSNNYEALFEADALVIITEWGIFRNPDFIKIKQLLKAPVVFDGRNLYKLEEMKNLGFTYFSIGRKDVFSKDLPVKAKAGIE